MGEGGGWAVGVGGGICIRGCRRALSYSSMWTSGDWCAHIYEDLLSLFFFRKI